MCALALVYQISLAGALKVCSRVHAGILTLFDLGQPSSDNFGSGEIEGPPVAEGEMPQRFERKDVWDVRWAEDNPSLFALMEKTRMYVFNGLTSEVCSAALSASQRKALTEWDRVAISEGARSFLGIHLLILRSGDPSGHARPAATRARKSNAGVCGDVRGAGAAWGPRAA